MTKNYDDFSHKDDKKVIDDKGGKENIISNDRVHDDNDEKYCALQPLWKQ